MQTVKNILVTMGDPAGVSGEVVALNAAIVDNPGLVNQAPHGDGWFFKIRMSKPAELPALMDFETYQKSAAH